MRNPEVSKYYRVPRSLIVPRSDRFRARGGASRVISENTTGARLRGRQAACHYPRRAHP